MAGYSEPRVVIVGAGMAGISAAHHLVTSGLSNVTVLEAASRIGGRIHTVEFEDGSMPVELGANWIHGAGIQNSSFKLADSIGALRPYRIWNRMSGRFLREDGTEIDRTIVTYCWNRFQEITSKCEKIISNEIANGKRENVTYAYFVEKLFKEQLDQDRAVTKSLGIEDLKRVFNALWNYAGFHEGDDLEKISFEFPETTCIMPGGDIHVPAGYNKLLKHLVRYLPTGCIQLNSEVVNIQWLNENGCVKILMKDRSCVEADHVIVTFPLGVLKRNHGTLFTPFLPVDKVEVIESIGFGGVNKIMLEYDQAVMPHHTQNIIFSWDDISIRNMKTDWVKCLFAFDRIYTKQNILLGWIYGDASDYMETLSDDEITRTCTLLLQKFLKRPDFPEPKRALITRWKSNPYIRGAYSYQTPKLIPGEQNRLSKPLTTKFGKPVVLFAGEATHQEYYSCTHGARDSGVRDAAVLLKLYSDKLHTSNL